MKTGCDQHAHDHAVKGADEWIACQRAGAGGATNEFIPAKAEAGPDKGTNKNMCRHNANLSACNTF